VKQNAEDAIQVLVVDDEKIMQDSLARILTKEGYEVQTASSGEEAIEKFDCESFDIVLLDIKMPGIDGLAVLQQIKEINPNAAVIVITGHGDTALAEQAVALDAVDFINKPIKKEALEAALEKAKKKLDAAKHGGDA